MRLSRLPLMDVLISSTRKYLKDNTLFIFKQNVHFVFFRENFTEFCMHLNWIFVKTTCINFALPLKNLSLFPLVFFTQYSCLRHLPNLNFLGGWIFYYPCRIRITCLHFFEQKKFPFDLWMFGGILIRALTKFNQFTIHRMCPL